VTGGQEGDKIMSTAYGLSFKEGVINGMRVLEAYIEQRFPDLPGPRYLHQSAGVRINGRAYLIVMGGKDQASSKDSLRSVHKLHIHDLISNSPPKKGTKVEQWVECAPMTSGRCLFASTCISDRFIYVYGGIASTNESRPNLSKQLFEKYDSTTNVWSSLTIENAPALSAFGWTEGYLPHELFILGGSDCSMLQSSLWKIDLLEGRATNLDIEFESSTALSKLAAIKDEKKGTYKIYAFGGSQSDGAGYNIDLSEERPAWKLLDHSYLSLFQGNEDRELMFKQGVHFQ